jgi:hypothetical protein
VWWGFITVLPVALSVRSYEYWDRCWFPWKGLGVQLNSDEGHVVLMVAPRPPTAPTKWFVAHRPSIEGSGPNFFDNDILGFYFKRKPSELRLDVPFWLVILTSATMGTTPWWRASRRFSLRTLLIAITLIAVVLGLAVWANS